MARNIQIREPGNNYADVLHPETNSGMVLMANGSTLQEDRDAHLAKNATLSEKGHVNHGIYNVTLDTTWSGSSAPFSKTQTVTGILATDNPIVDVVMSGTYATDEARQEAWSNIYRITTANNSITLYAKEKPTVNLPIQLKVVR